jgi:hypothetical protein
MFTFVAVVVAVWAALAVDFWSDSELAGIDLSTTHWYNYLMAPYHLVLDIIAIIRYRIR